MAKPFFKWVLFLGVLCWNSAPTLWARGDGLTYVLDMVHNNPGEQPTQTRYTDPQYVESLGYNGIVPQWHV